MKLKNKFSEAQRANLRGDAHYSVRIELLISLRNLCHLSVEIAAEKIDISRPTLTRYETMVNVIPTQVLTSLLSIYYSYIKEHNIQKTEHVILLEIECRKLYE